MNQKGVLKRPERNYPNHEVIQHCVLVVPSDSSPLRPHSQGVNRSRQLSYIQGRNSTKSLKIKRKSFPRIRFSLVVKESETTENSEQKPKMSGEKLFLSYRTL